MRVVQIKNVPVERRSPRGREGTVEARIIMVGDKTRVDNFHVRVNDIGDKVYSPRHRHNFDQFIYCLTGEHDYGPNMRLKPRGLAYVPEGTYYGPQNQLPHRHIAVQFAGPSGSGYLGQDEFAQGFEELKKTGTFEKGIYHPNPGVSGQSNQDSYEAIWEHIRGRPLTYPQPQYDGPILMDTDNFPWVPVDDVPGVKEKFYGTFSSARTRAAQYQLQRGADFVATGRGLYIALSGTGSISDEPYSELTTLYLDQGEIGVFRAETTSEILLLGLPSASRMASEPPDA